MFCVSFWFYYYLSKNRTFYIDRIKPTTMKELLQPYWLASIAMLFQPTTVRIALK